ncbi:meiotic recombination protein P22 [Drosophila tropicalis]|uniref:meiotic recombination protein P22 n=1 Tax=Drosophila tropicalis TaxID=46794 RepID=UPI0035AC05F5
MSKESISVVQRERSPELFEDAESELSQLICAQIINTTNDPEVTKISHGPSPTKSKDKVTKILHLRHQGKILKRSFEATVEDNMMMSTLKCKQASLTQVPTKRRSSNPRTRGHQPRKKPLPKYSRLSQSHSKRGRPPKKNPSQPAPSQSQKILTKPKANHNELELSEDISHHPAQQATLQYKNSFTQPLSPSKLPTQYPAHFVHQLPPSQETGHDGVLTPEPTQPANDMAPSPYLDSLSSSSSSSLCDSVARIFGTKDVNLVLKMECPRKIYLLDDHLPAMAMMLDVDLDRLRSVIDITQKLTHEQLVLWPQIHQRLPSSGNSS